MPGSSIKNQTVTATIPDFDFPVTFTVTGFSFKVAGKAAVVVTGNSLNSVASYTDNLRTGDNAYIFNIQVVANGLGNQKIRNVSNILINVQ